MKENKNTVLKELTSLLKEYSETEPVYDICGIHHSSHCLCPTYLSPRMFTINLSLEGFLCFLQQKEITE